MRTILAFLLLVCFLAFSSGYSTSGNRILDANGNPILLRGIDRPSLEWNSQGQSLSYADYQLMKGWGANVIRLSLNQCFWLSGNVGYDSNYRTTVAQQVTWIKSLSMGVILDLHWSNQGKSGTGCGQQAMPDSISSTFWTSVATIYKNDPSVIFELYNEPFGVSSSVWLNGGDTGNGFTTPGFQSLYNTVRATGANNVVLIGGLNWAFDLSFVPSTHLTGTNIAYATHPYDTPDRAASTWPSVIGAAANIYPIVATEFGRANADCGTSYLSQFLDYADANSISWTAWAWWVQDCEFPSLISSWSGATTPPGALVKSRLTSGPKVPSSSVTSAAATATTRAPTTTTTTSAATTKAATTKVSSTSTTGGSSTTGGGASTITVYDEAVRSPFSDWSWNSPRNAADSSKAHAGTYSYSFQPSAYGSVYFVNIGALDTSKIASVQFWIYYVNGNQQVNFNILKVDTANNNAAITISSKRVETYTTANPIPANTWVKGTVLLSSIPAGVYDGLWFQDQNGGTQSTVYVDDISLVRK